MKTKDKDYLFVDNESGEEFFVECDTLDKAWSIIKENFGDVYTKENIEYEDVFEPWQAEMMGFDTY